MVLLVATNNISYTGYATFATSEEVRSAVNVASADNAFKMLGDGAQICIAVEIDDFITYYHRIVKAGALVDVQEIYCADPGQDNVIVKFNSFDDLLSARSSPETFFVEKKNTGYYFFPSNYVMPGGEVQCTQSFQQRYCPSIYYHLTKSQMAGAGLACCANYQLTAEQQKAINELKSGKPSALASPFEFIFSTTGIIVSIIVIIFIVIVSSLIVMKPKAKKPLEKNPLEDYVAQIREQGYRDEDIRNSLLQSGWPEETVEDALKR